ncbi:lipocalin-like domain-containing protein [Verminephrobacter aporrectodeae]|uniref:lipocalin-like domain-containing protein n=1 Tax=Verminephrobacter aporrectodeae TaxID=1110389 RepID=UPI0022431443|nr:carotenoid 1,2-hydratase [Verminephrobacter aporrectodeae]MCW8176400.1 carotenoid 1,2-hydratase [Verminephrobacter aporrectodeae subsp. tuberculatae]MCW8203976.1 carotenoid 1,2-hydratase [Verminephrobacter aporrectodeae subsp. tuberculatae]
MSTRRAWLAAPLAVPLGLWGLGAAHALPVRTLAFPRDHGSHPELRTEWWYITGHAQAAGQLWGFQVTFFRSRVDAAQSLQSAFAAKQLLFAHAALSDVPGQRLLHAQRIARAGFGVAQANVSDTRIRLHDWTLERSDVSQSGRSDVPQSGPRSPASRYAVRTMDGQFGLDLRFDSTQPLLLQGRQGLSRKGPDVQHASYYYSQPQLSVDGSLWVQGRRLAVVPATGRAWLDHEWSETLLPPDAVGWDWVGMNLDDGSALTAFRLRRADGSSLWSGGSLRAPQQAVQVFDAGSVEFAPQRFWNSPQSGARYPVQWRLQTPVGSFQVRARFDNQELGGSGSGTTIYWEGLSDLLNGAGRSVGRGYLEMTGYAAALRL